MPDPKNLLPIRVRSARLRNGLTCLLATLALLLVLERFGAIGLQIFRQGLGGGDQLRRLAFEALTATPEVLYLLALWWIRQALAAFAEGDLYSRTITRMLDRVGTNLAVGAFLAVFLLPGISAQLGFGPGS